MPIKILIDSASDISRSEAKDYGIELISMLVNFEEKQYEDGVDLFPTEFYEKLIESDVLPKTSQITPYRFTQEYERLVNEGYDVLVITLASKLSGTYNSAVAASKNFKDRVYVVDSASAAGGERILCEYALQLIKKGLPIKEIVDELNSIKSKITVIAVVDTLEYLKKGGRISKTVAFVGGLLKIKPVITLIDGAIKVVGKARGSKNANNLLNVIISEKGGVDFTKPFGTLYSGLSDVMLKKYITDNDSLWKNDADSVPIYILGSTIGTHVGPGAFGVAFFVK